jgi:hypothetical protein
MGPKAASLAKVQQAARPVISRRIYRDKRYVFKNPGHGGRSGNQIRVASRPGAGCEKNCPIEGALHFQRYEYGAHADEVLQRYFPLSLALKTNIGNDCFFSMDA